MAEPARAGQLAADVLVVGAGPAGLGAAHELAGAGLQVLLVDENQQPGGQIWRQRLLPPEQLPAGTVPVGPNLRFLGQTVCHGLTAPGSALVSTPAGPANVRAEAVVVATGGLERVFPVPGWTLPGVITAGAAQTFVKGSGFLPYRRVVVAGSGPLLLAAAAQLVEAGVEVVALLEAARLRSVSPVSAARALRAPEVLLGEGGGYVRTLLRARVPVHTATGVAGIDGVGEPGAERVGGVRFRPLRADWSYAASPDRSLECDAVLLSHGFTSSTELVSQAGAELVWDEQRQTWRPVRDEDFATTVDRVVAVGDCAGVGGVRVAALEGQLAGAALAARLSRRTVRRPVARWRRQLARLETFRRGMDEVFRAGSGATGWATPHTCVCRCQETVMGEVTDAMTHGIADLHGIKLWTRAGMGSCQGRVCAPVLTQALAARGQAPGAQSPPRSRFPVRPMIAGDLADGAGPVSWPPQPQHR